MYGKVLASLALAALVHAAPIMEPSKTVEERQFTVGVPTKGGNYPAPTFIILPPITGPIVPSTKRDTEAVKERQFSLGDPSTWWGTGNEKPPGAGDGGIIIGTPITGGINPSNKKRQIIIGGGTDAAKAKIVALELEYETLLHTFSENPPKPIASRLRAIKEELLKYGIAIIKSPDGTTSTFTPGKRDFTLPGGIIPGGPIIPSKPIIPGGPIIPDQPIIPGGPIEVSN